MFLFIFEKTVLIYYTKPDIINILLTRIFSDITIDSKVADNNIFLIAGR